MRRLKKKSYFQGSGSFLKVIYSTHKGACNPKVLTCRKADTSELCSRSRSASKAMSTPDCNKNHSLTLFYTGDINFCCSRSIQSHVIGRFSLVLIYKNLKNRFVLVHNLFKAVKLGPVRQYCFRI